MAFSNQQQQAPFANTQGGSQGSSNTRYVGGGQGFIYDSRIGNAPLPPGMQGTADRAYTRTPQQNELSSWQLNQLVDQNNPYIQQARQQAVEQANSRGGLNSSIAAGNAQRAAIEAAAPFAMQNAGAFGQAAGDNQQYLNQMAQLQNQLSSQERIAQENRNAAGAGAAEQARAALQLQRERLAFEGEQQGLDRTHQLGMSQFGLGSQLMLGDQQFQQQMLGNLYQTQLGMVRDYGSGLNNMVNNAFAYGLLNPEFMANPEQMQGLIGGIYNMSGTIFNDMFRNLFNNFGGGG